MSSNYEIRNGGLADVLHAVLDRMHQLSGADLIALYPYDPETETFYAPVANGISDEGLLQSLPDMADQIQRYRADAAQGKASDDIQPNQYGPNVWLLVKRQPLLARDAPAEINGSFIRRNKIRSLIGLPLLAGQQLVALLYLNYIEHDGEQEKKSRHRFPSAEVIQQLENEAAQAAIAIEQARKAEELAAFKATTELVGQLSAIMPSSDAEGAITFRSRLERTLDSLVHATGTDAAAVYAMNEQVNRLTLIAEQGGSAAFPAALSAPAGRESWDLTDHAQLEASLADAGLHSLAVLPLRSLEHVHGALVVAGHDRMALTRKPSAVQLLLRAAADLIGGALKDFRLVDALEETNRTFSALSTLGRALLQPGASQDQVLEAVVAQLTDPAIPEFDFQFATIYLLRPLAHGELMVYQSAGATSAEAIDSVPAAENGHQRGHRVPRWVLRGERRLDSKDVLSFVARQQQTIVIAAQADGSDQDFVAGFPESRLERLSVPISRGNGASGDQVRAVLLRDAPDLPYRAVDGIGARTDGGGGRSLAVVGAADVQLQGDLFDESGHAYLIRVFVPFGYDPAAGQATGVLEAGYHIGRKRQLDRLQIEALNAAATQVAVAVETARLYEDSRKRVEQLEVVAETSRAMASTIDLEETLRVVARNLGRAVNASLCLVALFDDDGAAWYGAAASEDEELWRRQRVERPEPSVLFEVADRGRPIVVEDAEHSELVRPNLIEMFGIRSLLALPLLVPNGPPIGAVALCQRDQLRTFTGEEIMQASALTQQAALAIQNASMHAREEEEHHIQKDFVLIGFGQWGQKAYQHLLTLKQFFNFKTHIVEQEREGRRAALAEIEQQVIAHGDAMYWDSASNPAHDALQMVLEPSCYVITYIATPAETHLPVLKQYYDLSNVVLIEKPLGAPLEEYREFLDSVDGSVQLVAADHYYFKLEVRLLQLLLTEEKTLKNFLDEIEEIEIQVLEKQPPGGSGAQIGMIADLVPHAFAILSLFTPLDRLQFSGPNALHLGRYQPATTDKETFVRLYASFPHKGRQVRVIIDAGKGVVDAKWIKLSGARRMGGKRSFYKFDFGKGEAVDGTQTTVSAAIRHVRQPGVPDSAHISMLRHVIERKYPAVGILAIREAMRSNQRIQELEVLAAELLRSGQWTPYEQGQRPAFTNERPPILSEAPRPAPTREAALQLT